MAYYTVYWPQDWLDELRKSAYKLRNTEILHKGWRIQPSYIMTGQNLLIEKSKFQMASEDIALMYRLINEA